MKKFTNNKRYNTETAKKICEWKTENISEEDPGYCEQELYRKNTGEYFLHGIGGAKTRYAKIKKGAISQGEDIIPIGLDEAQKIAKKYTDPETYNLLFGKITTKKVKQINLSLDAGTGNLLKLLQAKTGKTAVEIIGEMIKEYAEREGL